MVNTAEVLSDEMEPEEHLHAHVYHQGIASKCGNNVASLLILVLKQLNIMREGEIGGELNVIFDNCSSQNKNNMVICLVAYFIEL